MQESDIRRNFRVRREDSVSCDEIPSFLENTKNCVDRRRAWGSACSRLYTVSLLLASTKLFHVGLEKDLGAEKQHVLWNLIF